MGVISRLLLRRRSGRLGRGWSRLMGRIVEHGAGATLPGPDRERDGGNHKDPTEHPGGFGQSRDGATRSESSLADAAESGCNVDVLAALDQYNQHEQQRNQNVYRQDQAHPNVHAILSLSAHDARPALRLRADGTSVGRHALPILLDTLRW